jgi:hypothetical protein
LGLFFIHHFVLLVTRHLPLALQSLEATVLIFGGFQDSVLTGGTRSAWNRRLFLHFPTV